VYAKGERKRVVREKRKVREEITRLKVSRIERREIPQERYGKREMIEK